MRGTLPIIERELRRFKRSPVLIIISLIFPIVQLVVLGYAFGGNVRNLKVGVVDQDQRLPAVKLRELAGAVAANAATFETIQYADSGAAMTDLRNGRINGVLTIPSDFSKRAMTNERSRVALIEDNTDNFVAATLAASLNGVVSAYNTPALKQRIERQPTLDVVEVYPYVPYAVFAARIDRHVDLYDGDDRRRHHLY